MDDIKKNSFVVDERMSKICRLFKESRLNKNEIRIKHRRHEKREKNKRYKIMLSCFYRII